MTDKLEQLNQLLQTMGRVAVAYSGGVDSTLLLKVAHNNLGERAIALTAVSPSMPADERAAAEAVVRQIGARHVLINTAETADPRYQANTPDRCYFCKGEICDALLDYARREGYAYLVDGNNADDADDYRPGRRAALERGVRSPLQEVGLTKAEIRSLARQMGLPNWDKPSAACLSSRIPYGTPISLSMLAQVEQAERILKQLGLRQLRARHHGQLVRIEVPPADFNAVMAAREQLIAQLKALGYTYVTLDLAGFRTGSMNEVITDGRS